LGKNDEGFAPNDTSRYSFVRLGFFYRMTAFWQWQWQWQWQTNREAIPTRLRKANFIITLVHEFTANISLFVGAILLIKQLHRC